MEDEEEEEDKDEKGEHQIRRCWERAGDAVSVGPPSERFAESEGGGAEGECEDEEVVPVEGVQLLRVPHRRQQCELV